MRPHHGRVNGYHSLGEALAVAVTIAAFVVIGLAIVGAFR